MFFPPALYMLVIASIPLYCPVVRARSEIRQLAGAHDARQCRHWRANNARLVHTYHCMGVVACLNDSTRWSGDKIKGVWRARKAIRAEEPKTEQTDKKKVRATAGTTARRKTAQEQHQVRALYLCRRPPSGVQTMRGRPRGGRQA